MSRGPGVTAQVRASHALRTFWLMEGAELRGWIVLLLPVDCERVLERKAKRGQHRNVGRGGHYMVHSVRQREVALLAASHSQTAAQSTPSGPARRTRPLAWRLVGNPGAQNWL